MFNNVRRCLIISIRIPKKFLISFHKGVLLPVTLSHANAQHSYNNNAAYKRFYCHSLTNKKILTSTEIRDQRQKLDEQKFEDFLSDPQNKKRFQILELEVDVLRHSNERVPKNIEPAKWLKLLSMKAKSSRRKFLEFLWRCEISNENKKAKKELKRAEWLTKKEEQTEDTGEMKYGLSHNTLFMRIYEQTMNRFYNGRIIMNMMFEPKIVFDCGYENDMNDRELHNCAKQISLAFASNRSHVNAMTIYFCNFNKDGLLRQYLEQNIPTLLSDDFPAVITSQSYLDIFPKNELVYLTPHCRVNLTEYNPNMTYIIGGLVDKNLPQPLSLAKAKKEGIQMAKFPIDQYLDWGASSSKSLTLDQTIKIMLDLRQTGDWKKALQNVPTRKLRSARENRLQYKMQKFMSPERIQQSELDFTFQRRKMK
ncbi:mitochondrial ribonuclease P protein 1 homolog [Monomorium pharaonis]|uniref:mitochondrial ribonuclease P protein 1 homolog n=1 Tax=Monomorium pharaonis TaxID=307658 RepID=UPI0017474B6D|nr:mitochondrial ribonuclease P protein 1 homolog [Monomorium pharaonis]